MLNKCKRGIAALLSLILLIGAIQLPVFATTEVSGNHVHEETAETLPEATEPEADEPAAIVDCEESELLTATLDLDAPRKPAKRVSTQSLNEFKQYFVAKSKTFPEKVDVSGLNIYLSEWETYALEILQETPEAFHVKTMSCNYNASTLKVTTFNPVYRDFVSTEAGYNKCLAEMKAAADTILNGIEGNANLNDVDKALLIHDRLALWSAYNEPWDPDNIIDTDQCAYGPLALQLGVCQGYAMAYMYMMERVGITVDYCSSKTMRHGWNIVYIDDVAYHVDVTSDDPSASGKTSIYDHRGMVYHNYFLVSTAALRSYGYTATDFNTAPQNTRYDAFYWQESHAAFQYVGGKFYYINSEEESLYVINSNGYHQKLLSVADKWYYDSSHWYYKQARLASAGNKLLYNTSTAIVEYDIFTGTTKNVVTPSLSGYNRIYGFKYEGGKIIYEVYNHFNYNRLLTPVRVSYTPVCVTHSYTVLQSQKNPTCTTNGSTVYKCAYCAATNTVTADALGHSFTNYKSNNNATCTADGTKTAKCDRCSVTDTKADTGSKLGHNYVKTSGSATCTSPGTATFRCSRCGDSYTQSSGTALGHSFTNYKSNNDATCTKDGTKTAKCDRCSVTDTKTDTNSKLGHSFTTYVSNKDGTCQKDGTKTAKCDRCTVKNTVTEVGSKTDHRWNSGVYTEGTSTTEGYTTYTCQDCGTTKKEVDYTVAQITAQPKSVTVDTGSTVQFKVSTKGVIKSYQWQYRKVYKWFDTTLTGYNTNTLTVPATGARNGYDYRCVITFKNGTVLYTDPAELTVNTFINITSHPKDQVIALGNKAQFTAAATGESVKYQWQYCRPDSEKWIDTSMEGATKPTVQIETTASRNGYRYRCKITDIAGKEAYTEPATMSVLSVTKHPTAVKADVDDVVIFTVGTSVGRGFTYQWQYSKDEGTTWSDTTSAGYNTGTLEVTVTKARHGYLYRCALIDGRKNKVYSNSALLTVKSAIPVPQDPAVITAQPENATALRDGNVKFSVKATGAAAYKWQYSKNGTTWNSTTMTGYDTATLTVTASDSRNGYLYRCTVTGKDGVKVESAAAALTVVKITEQPKAVTATEDTNASFSIGISDTTGIRYEWQYSKDAGVTWSGTTMTGYNTATLTVAATMSRNGYRYRCILKDASGNKLTSGDAALTVEELVILNPAVITAQPKGGTALVGGNAKFTIKATGATAYKWYYSKNGTDWIATSMDGYNTNTLTVGATDSRNGYRYRCTVTGEDGVKVDSKEAILTVAQITDEPVNKSGFVDGNVKFTLKLSDTSGLKYQWQYRKSETANWTNTTMTGYDTKTLTVAVTAARNGYQYRCKITDAFGNTVESGAAVLTAVKITQHPVSKAVVQDGTAVFTAAVTEGATVSYQWQYTKDGNKWSDTSMEGYNTANLKVVATAARNGYRYRCMIIDSAGNKAYTDGAAMSVLSITVQPVNVDTVAGSTVDFTLATNIIGAFTYQWQYTKDGNKWSDTTMAGYNTGSLLVTATTARNGYQYRCRITDESGNVLCSDIAALRVLGITKHPVSVKVDEGQMAQFAIETNLTEGFTYRWQYTKDGTNWYKTTMTGYNTATLQVEATAARNGYQYRCAILVDGEEVLTSEAATLTVIIPEPEIPLNPAVIKTQPKAAKAFLNGNAQFSVKATGAVSYLWQYRRNETANWSGTSMTGYNTDTLTVGVTAARNGYQYRCVITGEDGVKVYTEAAALTVLEITEQPAIGYGFIGSISKFTVKLSDTTGVKYQWQYRRNETANWTNTSMTGYNTKTLTVDVTAARNGYQYRCVLTDSFGNTLESEGAALTVVKILQQPADRTNSLGGTAEFVVTVSHPMIVSYQWQYRRNETANWTNTYMDGFNTDLLCVEATSGRNGYQYRCILKLENGSTLESNFATLTIG